MSSMIGEIRTRQQQQQQQRQQQQQQQKVNLERHITWSVHTCNVMKKMKNLDYKLICNS